MAVVPEPPMEPHFLRLCAVLLALWLIGNPAAGAQTPPEAGIPVPTEMCLGYFFVPVTLRARDDAPDRDRTLWFVYDTGASTTYVDADSLERVSGRRIDEGDRVRITDATAGRVTYHTLPARVGDLDHLSITLGREIDGILAHDAFGDSLVVLDYAAGQIRLGEGRLPPPDGRTVFDAAGADERPWLRVEFPGGARRMLIDSGAGLTALAVNALDGEPTLAPPRPTGAAVRFRHVEQRLGARLDGEARIGAYRLDGPILETTPGSQIIGGLVMRHFVWTFDTAQARVRIEPATDTQPVRFEPLTGHGMVLSPEADGMRVAAILADSPAAGADIRRGDLVTHFDGLPLRERGCAPRRTDVVTVTLLRDGAAHDVRIDLFALVD